MQIAPGAFQSLTNLFCWDIVQHTCGIQYISKLELTTPWSHMRRCPSEWTQNGSSAADYTVLKKAGSLPNSKAKVYQARVVLGLGTARERHGVGSFYNVIIWRFDDIGYNTIGCWLYADLMNHFASIQVRRIFNEHTDRVCAHELTAVMAMFKQWDATLPNSSYS